MLMVELRLDLDILEHIRLAFEVPKSPCDRGAGPCDFELAPSLESAACF
jgi:hypothetical protein